MSNIWGSDVVIKSLRVVFYNDFTLTFALILSFYEFFFNIVIPEWLDERTKFFLLIISC